MNRRDIMKSIGVAAGVLAAPLSLIGLTKAETIRPGSALYGRYPIDREQLEIWPIEIFINTTICEERKLPSIGWKALCPVCKKEWGAFFELTHKDQNIMDYYPNFKKGCLHQARLTWKEKCGKTCV